MGLFSRRKREDEVVEKVLNPVVLGATGKLPSHADFIRVGEPIREAQTLESMVREWFVQHQRVSGEPTTIGVLMTGGEDRSGLVAIVYPSADSAGRDYPWVVYGRWALPETYGHPAALFAAANQAVTQLTEQTLMQLSNHSSIELWQPALLNEAKITLMQTQRYRREAMNALHGQTLRGWINELTGDADQFAAQFLAMYHQLLQQARRPSAAYLGMVLPLGDRQQADQSLCFWLLLLQNYFTQRRARPDLAWHFQQKIGRLYVLTKPLTVSHLVAISAPTDSDWLTPNELEWTEADVQPLLNELDSPLIDALIAWERML